jgi:hypothetical protein
VVKAGNLLFLLNNDAEVDRRQSQSEWVRANCSLHRRRQRHMGTANDLGKSHLRQGCQIAVTGHSTEVSASATGAVTRKRFRGRSSRGTLVRPASTRLLAALRRT